VDGGERRVDAVGAQVRGDERVAVLVAGVQPRHVGGAVDLAEGERDLRHQRRRPERAQLQHDFSPGRPPP
jgi:hypothetical protein